MAIEFPNWVKPVTNANYSYQLTRNNVNYQPVQGGLSRASLKYTQEAIPFNVNFVINNGILYQAWIDWWFNVSAQGTKKFAMDLDSGNGVEHHVCIAVPATYSATGDYPWRVSLTVEAEKMPTSLGGSLFNLVQGGYLNPEPILDRLAVYANEDVKLLDD